MEKLNYLYSALVTNVVDGDTIDVEIDLGFYVVYKTRLRLNGIDTPEKNSKIPEERILAAQATSFLRERILNKKVIIESFKKDKYGRFLADIYLGEENVNLLLVDLKLALPYSGGSKSGEVFG